MKSLGFLGVVLLIGSIGVQLVTCRNGNEKYFPETFLDNYKKIRDSIFPSETNLTDIVSLKFKIDAFYEVSWQYGVGIRPLRSIYMTLDTIRYQANQILETSPEGIMERISQSLENFDFIFDELNMQRNIAATANDDDSEISSKINNLIDEFVKRYTETLAELFDNIHIKAERLAEGVQKPASELSALIDTLAETVQKCLVIPQNEFKQISQCRQDTRESILPTLAHNSGILGDIVKELPALNNLQLDGKTSVYQLYYDMRSESFNLYQQIQELRDQHMAENEGQSKGDDQ